MTGAEHYLKAEGLLKDAYRTPETIAEAQVHATLAVAAAAAWGAARNHSRMGASTYQNTGYGARGAT